jgi:hypothetical protein
MMNNDADADKYHSVKRKRNGNGDEDGDGDEPKVSKPRPESPGSVGSVRSDLTTNNQFSQSLSDGYSSDSNNFLFSQPQNYSEESHSNPLLFQNKKLSPAQLEEWNKKLYDYITKLNNEKKNYNFDDLKKLLETEVEQENIPTISINSYSVLKNWYIDQKYSNTGKGKKNRGSKILFTIGQKIAQDNKSSKKRSGTASVTSATTTHTMVIPNSIGNLVKQEFYPLDTLCILNDDLNYALRRSFEERIDKKIDNTIRDKIGDLLFPQTEEKTLRQEIDDAITNCNDQIDNANAIVDACDIIHDVEYVTEFNGTEVMESNYIKSLRSIFKGETKKKFDTMIAEIIKTPSNLQQIVNKYKEGALSEVITCIQNHTSFPQISYTPLSLAEGYFELICNEMKIAKSVYRESGRKASLNKDKLDKIILQYEGDFWEHCRDWCNNNFSDTERDQLLLDHDKLPTDKDYKTLYKNLLPCTTIDGCGTTDKDEHTYRYHEYQFNKTFGHYTYKVFTKYIETTPNQEHPWKHIIIVYKDNDLYNPIAIFSLAQNATIDLLLTSLNMPATRGGDGGKGAVQDLQTTVTMFNDPEIAAEYKKISENKPEEIKKESTRWGKIVQKEAVNKELIGLGIKTLGDKVMREYNNKNPVLTEPSSASSSVMPPAPPTASSSALQPKGFQELTNVITTDKGIVFSNILDFIQSTTSSNPGNSNLAGILRSTGKGWTFTKGQSQINREEKIKQFRRKFTSYYFFIKSFGTDSDKKIMEQIKNNLGITFGSDTNIERFEGIKNLHEIYKDIKNNNNKLAPKSSYAYIMGKLLESEDDDRQKKIENIQKEIGKLNHSNLLLNFSNLPDLKTHFISSVSVFTESNSSIYNLFIDGFSLKDVQAREESTSPSGIKKLPPPSVHTLDISFNNGNIKINYNAEIENENKSKYAEVGTLNAPHELNDIRFSSERIDKSNKTYTYYIETPITLDFLIQLKEANESESNPFYNKIKRPDDVVKIDSLINELLAEAQKYAGLTEQPFKAYQDEFFKKLEESTLGKMDTIEEEKEGYDSDLTIDGGKKKRVTRKKIQVKRKQRNTLRKSTIKPINKKTRGRRNKKKKRSVTFKL